MSQIKVFGLRSHLGPIIPQVSDIIHSCVVDALDYPPDKRAHRFFQLDRSEFFYPAGRTDQYTIIELSMFEGRTTETKRKLIRLIADPRATQLSSNRLVIEVSFRPVKTPSTPAVRHHSKYTHEGGSAPQSPAPLARGLERLAGCSRRLPRERHRFPVRVGSVPRRIHSRLVSIGSPYGEEHVGRGTHPAACPSDIRRAPGVRLGGRQ